MFAVKPRVNLALDTLLLILFLVALTSGLVLEYSYAHGNSAGGTRSRGGRAIVTVEQTGEADEILGLSRAQMSSVHLYSALAGAALIGLHLVFHLKWIACQVRRLFMQPVPAPARHNQTPGVKLPIHEEAAHEP